MQRLLFVLCVLLSLSGCGFKPRASLALGPELGPVKVQTADPFSPLGQGLSTALARAGAQSPVADEPAAVLRVLSETLATRPLSVGAQAQVNEYETRYRVQFDLIGADGSTRLAPQVIELTRDFTYDNVASAGSPAEQALIESELRRDMQAAILRRLDAALRVK
jgi:LPS-assembly lipoprotein